MQLLTCISNVAAADEGRYPERARLVCGRQGVRRAEQHRLACVFPSCSCCCNALASTVKLLVQCSPPYRCCLATEAQHHCLSVHAAATAKLVPVDNQPALLCTAGALLFVQFVLSHWVEIKR